MPAIGNSDRLIQDVGVLGEVLADHPAMLAWLPLSSAGEGG